MPGIFLIESIELWKLTLKVSIPFCGLGFYIKEREREGESKMAIHFSVLPDCDFVVNSYLSSCLHAIHAINATMDCALKLRAN